MWPNLFLALHLLAAVLWVGGMAFALLALRPSLGLLPPPARLTLLGAVLRRFFLIVWHAMPILLLTGYGLLFGWHGGFSGAFWTVHLMHLTGLVMAVVFLALFFGPWRRMRAALSREAWAEAGAAHDRIRRLVTLNLLLGLGTVAVAAWGRFG